uniref:Uncharacterized protein n=1 Tax=uncultured prokaryote TaxID=198431 RepID=A0A0H5Q8T7_9ZZZZ|nr:hypothetical protein [uncultured prokaryote]
MRDIGSVVNPLWFQPSLLPEDDWLRLTVNLDLIGGKQFTIGLCVEAPWQDLTIGASVTPSRQLVLPGQVSDEISIAVTAFLEAHARPF